MEQHDTYRPTPPLKNLIISLDLVEVIGNYLITKPYGEVWQIIQALQQLQPAPEPEPQEPPHAAKE